MDDIVCLQSSATSLQWIIAITYFTGVFFQSVSWVDRLWSLTPPWFMWQLYQCQRQFSPALLLCLIISVWGLRLTFNFYRKGGYSSTKEEDYRWPILRSRFQRIFGTGTIWFFLAWEAFHLGFICIFQHALLWSLIAIPVHYSHILSLAHWSPFQYVLAFIMFLWIVMETIADQQQWNFHQYKYQKSKRAQLQFLSPAAQQDIKDGFLHSTGLFKYSRHPNFYAEQMFWWTFALCCGWPLMGSWPTTWQDPQVLIFIPAMVLTALFNGSTAMTEAISAGKYPKYRLYQQDVSRWMPWFPATPTTAGDKRRPSNSQPVKNSPRPRRAVATPKKVY